MSKHPLLQKPESKPTNLVFRIEFRQNDSVVTIADSIPNIEDAVAFALNLHKASNSPHRIYVMHDDIIDITFSLCGAVSE